MWRLVGVIMLLFAAVLSLLAVVGNMYISSFGTILIILLSLGGAMFCTVNTKKGKFL